LVGTSLGPVEVAVTPNDGEPVVVCFPGGHATAATPVGTDLYTELGYRVLSISRPGYGRTRVGPLTAAEFVRVVAEVCERLDISAAAATVGISFGGLQAIEVAVSMRSLAPRLVLHSCAPSTLPYPDTMAQRIAAPLVFNPRVQRLTWHLVRLLTSSDSGLQRMMASLSTVPIDQWWATWTPTDRQAARATFSKMSSGSGFVTDVRQAGTDRKTYREAALRSVPCPTLVTASRTDGGVSFTHAEDFVRTIPQTRLVDTGAESHFYWLGPRRGAISDAIRTFMAE
jgi:pimeloyl-ACP methyl ester carboxylesterase